MMYKRLFILGCAIVLLLGCKKEPTSWSSNWSVPLVHGSLSLDDLIPAEYQTTNSDNYLSIVYSEPVYSFTIDTLVQLPDTTIFRKTAVAVPSLTVNPDFIYGDNYDQAYTLDQIELKRVIVKEGEVEMTIRNTWPGKTHMTFDFPKILDMGIPFNRIFYLEAGSISSPYEATELIQMNGFDLDLTGVSGNLNNTISGTITVGSNEVSASYDITNQDSIEYDITFRNLVPDYAKGYFGSYFLTDTIGISLDFMDKISGGSVDLDSLDMNIVLRNGFNLIAQSKITLLEGVNSSTMTSVPLSFPDFNTDININPASGGLYDYVPSEYPMVINNSNSNVLPFLENLSDSIVLGYELFVNPFGNITSGSDELFPGSSMELFLDAEFPVSFAANNMVLRDTFDFSFEENSTVEGETASIALNYSNGFPLTANTSLYLLDETGAVIHTITADSPILSGVYDNVTYETSPTSGVAIFTLDQSTIALLADTKKIAFDVTFSTENSGNVKLQSSSTIDFNLNSDLQIKLNL
jgi:hypothetical protein